MNFIDTHTHLFLKQFENDIDDVISRSIYKGVDRFILPNVDVCTITDLKNLTARYPENCFPLMGLHATSVKADFEKNLEIIENQLKTEKFYGVGEIGIDLYWDKTFLEHQKRAFIYQINLAKELGLPIVIHARESFDKIFEVMDKHNDDNLSGIFHCFTGNLKQAEKIIDYQNFKLGIGGVLTFKNSGLDKTVENIDLEHLVLETDSPFLAPKPHRGKRNESSYILLIAQKLAEVKKVPLAEIAKITTENAENLFFK